MKRSLKILLISLAVTMVVSFGIAAIILVVSGNFNVATETINDSKTFEPSEISSIEVDLVSDDLNIIPTSEGDLTVHFYGEVSTNVRRNLPELVAYKTGDKLYVDAPIRCVYNTARRGLNGSACLRNRSWIVVQCRVCTKGI